MNEVWRILTWSAFEGEWDKSMVFIMVIFNTMIAFHIVGGIAVLCTKYVDMTTGTRKWEREMK